MKIVASQRCALVAQARSGMLILELNSLACRQPHHMPQMRMEMSLLVAVAAGLVLQGCWPSARFRGAAV